MTNVKYVFLISCLCVREEIMVATEEGSLHRIKWNASVNQKASFHIRGFPASLDFHQTKGTEQSKDGLSTCKSTSSVLSSF